MNPKSIYVSYANQDIEVASRVRDLLKTWLGSNNPIYMRDFDINLGSNRISILDETLEEVKWFIIVYTEFAAQSTWIQHEISTQALKTVEKSGYAIIILKVNNIDYPDHLAPYLGSVDIWINWVK